MIYVAFPKGHEFDNGDYSAVSTGHTLMFYHDYNPLWNIVCFFNPHWLTPVNNRKPHYLFKQD